mgnify:CR=1 FL=1|tara:strand:+ start:124 stop:459 length:336 start_codon:yes stop_codon:yes gene_type:complete
MASSEKASASEFQAMSKEERAKSLREMLDAHKKKREIEKARQRVHEQIMEDLPPLREQPEEQLERSIGILAAAKAGIDTNGLLKCPKCGKMVSMMERCSETSQCHMDFLDF